MKYKHKITGAIIEINSKITSDTWECVEALPNSCKKPRKKRAKKDELCNSK